MRLRLPYIGLDREIVGVSLLLLLSLSGLVLGVLLGVSAMPDHNGPRDQLLLECPAGHPVTGYLFVDELDEMGPENRCGDEHCPWVLVWQRDDVQSRAMDAPEAGEWRWTMNP